jgi:hypothetical protein
MFRKIIFWFLLPSGLLGAVGGYYLWHQATDMPQLDTKTPTVDLNAAQPEQIDREIKATKTKINAQMVESLPDRSTQVMLTDRDLTNLVADRLRAHPNPQVPAAVSKVDAKISAGKIHAGAVVNLSEISRGAPGGTMATAVDRLTEALPMLKDQNVYVSVVGSPQIDSQQLKFDRDTQVKVGNLSFSIGDISQRLGIPEEKIQQAIDLKLQQNGLSIDNLSIGDSLLTIQGRVK